MIETVLFLVNMQIGNTIFALPSLIQLMSILLYVVFQVFGILINLYFTFKVSDLSQCASVQQHLASSSPQLFQFVYSFFSFIMWLPLSPVLTVKQLVCDYFGLNLNQFVVYSILLLLCPISLLRPKLLRVLSSCLTPVFYVLIVSVAVQSSPNIDLKLSKNNLLPTNWFTIQYSMMFLLSMYQTYALVLPRKQLKNSFISSCCIATVICFVFGFIESCQENLPDNLLLSLKRTVFNDICIGFYVILQMVNTVLLLQLYGTHKNEGYEALGPVQEQIDNKIKKNMVNTAIRCVVMVIVAGIDIAFNNLAFVLTFVSNLGSPIVCQIGAIICFKGKTRIAIMSLMMTWCVMCLVLQLLDRYL
ncbi:Hypothetical_protein [Hexamita inflata]|uniref:Hypothetical_protein n=1 Tax=Hexamita inflata TaxID=28002 RepID=A0ABP1JSY9_9EUKA